MRIDFGVAAKITPKRTKFRLAKNHKCECVVKMNDNEPLFATFANTTSVGIVLLREGRIVYVNPAFEQITGFTAAELDNVVFAHLFPTLTPLPPVGDLQMVGKDGLRRWVTISQAPTETQTLMTVVDITAHKEAEAALRESETRFQEVFRELQDVIAIVDKTHLMILAINPAVRRALGYEDAELIGKPLSAMLAPGQDQFFEGLRVFGALMESVYFLRADHSACPMDVNTTRVAWGGASAIMITLRNVTERVQREKELEAVVDTTNMLRNVLRAAPTRADMLPIVLSQITDLFHVDGVAVISYNKAEHKPSLELGTGIWAEFTGQLLDRVDMDRERNSPFDGCRIIDLRQDREYAWIDPSQSMVMVLGVPLMVNDKLTGSLWVGRTIDFSREEIRLLAVVADIMSNALQRVGVMETLERHVAERTAELEAANEQLRNLDKLKTQFVSDVSHELRTPLTSLAMYGYLLEHDTSANVRNHIIALNKQIERLKTLVHDILDISRLDRQGELARRAVTLNDLVGAVVIAHEAVARSKKLELRLSPGEMLPNVLGDASQIERVVENLLANAINYTPAGSIMVSTHLDSERGQVCLSITDTGIGIDEQDLPRLFERFYRGQRARQLRVPGSGLGLGIVKEIVDQHGGALEVSSTVGRGTTFRVYLPLAQPSPA